MAKGKRSKGKRRGGKRTSKKSRVSRKLSKPGLAETLGILKTGIDMAGSRTGADVKGLYHNPNLGNVKILAGSAVADVKQYGGSAVVGLIVSNIEVIPIVGKLAAPVKRRADRILKKWIGMKL